MIRKPTESRSISSQTPETKVQDMIRRRAYDICMKRGCRPGNEWKDWFEAEKQVKIELGLK